MMADEVADRIVKDALYYAGISMRPNTRKQYLDLVGPGITEDYALSRVYSGCGLVAEGLHRRAGVDAACLYKPYQVGTAIGRAIKYMGAMGAWAWAVNQIDMEPRPQPGCYVVIGCRSAGEQYGGTEHALTVTSWDEDVVTSVDGGQKDALGYEAIALRQRRWVQQLGKLWLVDPKTGKGRRVLGWGDPRLFKYR